MSLNPQLSATRSYKTLLIIGGQGINALISFFFFPYLARALSLENYGSYGQVMLVSDLTKSFFIMGLTNIVYIQLSNKSYDPATVFKSNLLFSFVSGTIAALLIYAGSSSIALLFKNNDMTLFVKIISLSLFFQIPCDYLNAVLIYFDKIKHSIVALVVSNFIKIFLLYGSIHYFESMDFIFYSFGIVSLIQLILLFILFPKSYLKTGKIDVLIMKAQILLSVPLIFSGILGYLLQFIDGFLVSSLLSVKDFALFRNGAFEIPFISIIYSSVSAITLPELSKLDSNKDIENIIELKRKATTSIALFTIPASVFILFFSVPVITLLFGNTYAPSAIVFFIINLLVFLRINDYQDILIIRSAGRFILLYNIICLLLNVILSYSLIHVFGIAGAAAATTLSIYVFAFLLLNKSAGLLKTSLFSFFDLSRLVPILIISVLCSLTLYLFYSLINNNIMVVPFGLVYILTVYFIFYKLKFLESPIIKHILGKFNFTQSR